GVAFAANIGGLGTLVGSPPNAIAASVVGISFAQWMSWGLPLVLVMLPATEWALRACLKPQLDVVVSAPDQAMRWHRAHFMMLGVFALTVLLWMAGGPLGEAIGFTRGYEAAVAVLALVLLHALNLASWKNIEKSADWGVLLLFGGGLTLSRVIAESGAGAWMAGELSMLFAAMPVIVVLTLMILFALALTEVTSKTASAALLIQVFFALAPAVD